MVDIVYIYDAVYPWIKGGAEKRIYEVGRRLAKKHEVHWFGIKWWDGRDIIEHEGIILHGVCKPYRLYVDGKRSIKEALIFASKLLPKLAGENSSDIIDCQEFPYFPCFSSKFYSVIKRTPLVITWYEIWGKYWLKYLGKKGICGYIVEKLTLRLPELIIANSNKIREDLISLGVNGKKITVSPNGIDVKMIDKIKPKDEEFDILYAGRLIEHKRVDLLIKAVSIVKKELPDIRCGIIGDGPEKQRLEKLARDLNVEKNVKFFGFLEKGSDVLSYMKSSKIFVLPSMREGSPITVVEANACGLPVITVNYRDNGTVSLINEGENGFVCELNERSIASRILQILTDDNLRSYLRRKSVEISRNYDWSKIADNLIKIYGEIYG